MTNPATTAIYTLSLHDALPIYLLDEALLILGVEDLEALSEIRLAPVQPQQPVCDAVKGADPQSAAGHTEQSLDASTHLPRSEEHTSELQSHSDLVCRLLLEKRK